MRRPILLIEDEDAFRLLVQDFLEFLGYDVEPAPDGRTALEVAASTPICMAFVDINLPDITGDEVMRTMRNDGIDVPMVVLSGNLRESYASRIADLQVSKVLEKPVDLEEIQRVLHDVLGEEAPGIAC